MIRTKILATLGPVSRDAETIGRLLEAGADLFRLNFSHGTLDEHRQTLQNIRAAAAKLGQPVAVLGDLCGPKIRVGKVKDAAGTGGMPVEVGDDLVLQRDEIEGHSGRISCTWPAIIDDVKSGDRVLIEDGLLRFVCTETAPNEVRLRALGDGVVKTGKGINLPNTNLRLEPITQRDWECVAWVIEHELDYVALSFVRRADDLNTLREHLRLKGSDAQIVAKIEKPEAIAQIDQIIDASDAIMVARGDLGVEMDLAQVPLIQKELIRRSNAAAKPVIVATQMLQSMIESSTPTRAEVSDVANAIFDGADAVMLSGETSVGKHAVTAVHMMSHIAKTTEAYFDKSPPETQPASAATVPLKIASSQLSAGVARGVRLMVADLKLRLVVIYSQTGSTARMFSKFRFPVPILALSSDESVLRKMSLNYGVFPIALALPGDINELVEVAEKLLLERKLVEVGERVAIIAGSSLGAPGTLNGVLLHTVGEMEERRGGK